MGLAAKFTAPFTTFLNPLSLVRFLSSAISSLCRREVTASSFVRYETKLLRAVGEGDWNCRSYKSWGRKKRKKEGRERKEDQGTEKAKTSPRGVSFARNVHRNAAFPRDENRWITIYGGTCCRFSRRIPLTKSRDSLKRIRRCVLGRLRAICPTDLHALRAEIRPTRPISPSVSPAFTLEWLARG